MPTAHPSVQSCPASNVFLASCTTLLGEEKLGDYGGIGVPQTPLLPYLHIMRFFLRPSVALLTLAVATAPFMAFAWEPKIVQYDPLVRMPGTQPRPDLSLESSANCMACHGGYAPTIEAGFTWKGTMMAQSARDPFFWAALTVAAQDSVWALGNPNGTDICLRCHMPKGWLELRSDPTSGAAMSGDDFDGVQCDFCHRMVDPFFQDTYDGVREGNDWATYWDESNMSSTPSSAAADMTYAIQLAYLLQRKEFLRRRSSPRQLGLQRKYIRPIFREQHQRSPRIFRRRARLSSDALQPLSQEQILLFDLSRCL
jgi:hypothetical protein